MSAGTRFVEPLAFARAARAQAALSGAWSAGDPHLSLPWFALLAETAMPAEARLALLPCGTEDRAAFLPMMALPETPGRVAALANFYTPLFGLINPEQVLDTALVQHLRELRQAGGINELRFAPLAAEGQDIQLLQRSLRAAGWWVGSYFCFGNWFHRVEPGGAERYFAGRPSQLRHTLQRAERKLAREADAQLVIVEAPGSQLDDAIAHFTAVYATSWKEPEPYPQFIPGLCRLAAGEGSLRLGVLKLGGQPIAAQLWLVANATASIVKLAYDPAFARYSPGTVLTAALCRRVIDQDGVHTLDYLIGDDAYKQDWMSQRRERHGLVAFNTRRPAGALGAIRHLAGAWWRQRR